MHTFFISSQKLIFAAERQRGSTLFLAFHSIQSFARNYVKSNLDLVSVIPSDCRNSGEQYIRRLFWGGGGGGSNYFFDCVCMFSSIDFHVVFVYTISREFTGNILQKNYKETNIFFRMDMALFLSADFHQGNEISNVHSRGKQCA